MAGPEQDAEDRTEAATPRRLQRARDEGQVPLTREASSFAVLAAATLVLSLHAPAAARELTQHLAMLLENSWQLDPLAALRYALFEAARTAAPFALASILASSAAVLLQTGFLLNGKAIQPDLSRISPLAGFKRVFGVRTLLEAGKAVIKAVVAVGALVMVMMGALPALHGGMVWPVEVQAAHIGKMMVEMLGAAAAVQGVVAGADLLRARLKFMRDLRMSREDMRQEMRETEGDPHIKARLRALRMQRSRRRMMAAVKKATVVVVNPTHYAVALAYQRGIGGAPKVVAKGVDAVAARIRAEAEEHNVPIVANPPLARALYKVDLDGEIPAEHFKAVAEIIAYVWRLRRRASGAPGRARG